MVSVLWHVWVWVTLSYYVILFVHLTDITLLRHRHSNLKDVILFRWVVVLVICLWSWCLSWYFSAGWINKFAHRESSDGYDYVLLPKSRSTTQSYPSGDCLQWQIDYQDFHLLDVPKCLCTAPFLSALDRRYLNTAPGTLRKAATLSRICWSIIRITSPCSKTCYPPSSDGHTHWCHSLQDGKLQSVRCCTCICHGVV